MVGPSFCLLFIIIQQILLCFLHGGLVLPVRMITCKSVFPLVYCILLRRDNADVQFIRNMGSGWYIFVVYIHLKFQNKILCSSAQGFLR